MSVEFYTHTHTHTHTHTYMDYIVHGILWARILEWVAFPFSRAFSQPRDQTQVSRIAGDSLQAEPQGKLTE